MTWRDTYKIHPAADVFPMLPDDELQKLGDDIKANGLRVPVVVTGTGILLDGRNRLEAAERVGFKLRSWETHSVTDSVDPVAFIISSNIRRRHLTKQQQADLIVAAVKAGEKLDQVEPVSKGGRGKVNEVKAKAVEIAADAGISEATVKRSIARAEGKKPKPRQTQQVAENKLQDAMPAAEVFGMTAGIDAARHAYLLACENVDDLDAERGIINEALREIAGKRIMARQAAQARERVAVSAPAAPSSNYPELPTFLDRRPKR